MPEKAIYQKPALSIAQLTEFLISRGLIVDDSERACRYLRYIGYYRLSGYFRFFQNREGPKATFKCGASFNNVLNVYIFDRKLRLIVMDVIERIEVAIRSTISNTMSEKYGPHWYLCSTHFNDKKKHKYLIKQIKKDTGYENTRNQNEFCAHYYNTYKEPELPPSWMVAEVLTFGAWSKIYENLSNTQDKKTISSYYKLHPPVMVSWLRSISYLRNLCAHHSRIWNRTFTIKPKIPKKDPSLLGDNSSFYAQAVTLNVFLSAIINNNRWQSRFLKLLEEYPYIPISEMGFPNDWQKRPLWNI